MPGLLHGDCLTVTGATLAENLRAVSRPMPPGQSIVRPLRDPIKKNSHLVVLYGNLAPEGAVAKITGKEGLIVQGRARAYSIPRRARCKGILGGAVKAGDVVVIRYEGPKGGPGMREMLSPTGAIMGKGLGQQVALITDGRFSGGSHGFVVGHISPEAALGGPLALVRSGDAITIDAERREISLHVAAAELTRRRKSWQRAETLCAAWCAGEICGTGEQRILGRGHRSYARGIAWREEIMMPARDAGGSRRKVALAVRAGYVSRSLHAGRKEGTL